MQSCSTRENNGAYREPQEESYVAAVAIDYCRLPTGSWANGDTEGNACGLELWGLPLELQRVSAAAKRQMF